MGRVSKSLLVAILLLLQVQGSVAADRFPIVREQVLALLNVDGSGPQLVIPNVFSRVSWPQLRIIGKEQEKSSLTIRVGCLDAAECLPFFAIVQFGSAEEARKFGNTIVLASGSTIPAKHEPAVVRSGELAQLEVRLSEKVTARIEVRCLQSGRIEDVIRVRDEETRKTYYALVLGKGELRARL